MPKKKIKTTAKKKIKRAIRMDEAASHMDVIDVTPTKKRRGAKQPPNPTAKSVVPAGRSPAVISKGATGGLVTTDDPLVKYLNEIRKYPLLTPEKERELALNYREKGDKQAAETLVTSNLRFVVKIAAEYSRFGARMIDLIQEGNVGLMNAVKEFNPYKGVRLITYAVWWIRGYIREYLMRQHSLVRVGTTQAQKKLYYNLQKEQRGLAAAGLPVTTEELSERLGVSEKDVEQMKLRLEGRDVSLDAPLDTETENTVMSLQSDEHSTNPEEALMNAEQTAMLHRKIDTVMPKLNEKERYILEARLLADEPITLQQVGDQFGITRERARQLEARVLSKIRAAFDEITVSVKG